MPLELTPKKPPYYDIEGSGLGTKQYIAVLSQLGTANPTVEVIKDTLSEPIVWTRISAGVYTSQVITGEFPIGQTTAFIATTYPANVNAIQAAADQVTIYTGQPQADENLDNTPVIITVYP